MSTAHYFLTFGTNKKKEKTYFNIDINLSCDALLPLISSFLLTTLKFVKPAVLNWVNLLIIQYSMWSLVQGRPVLLCDIIFGKKIRLQNKRNVPSVYSCG